MIYIKYHTTKEMIVDIIIIAIMALSIFLGYKKGLVKLGIGLCAGIIAIAISLILYRPITNIVINTTNIDENIEQQIIEKSKTNEIAEQIAPEVAQDLSYNVIRAVVMIALYILAKIALRFVTALADLIAKLPILNQFNKAGGLIYGAIRGLLIIYVALLIVNFAGQVNPQNTVNSEVQKSFIAKEMYNKNIIELLVK